MRQNGAVELAASVIIPAHNAASTIGRQLVALAEQAEAPAFEVIVVVNRCTDSTAVVARSFSDVVQELTVVAADERGSAAYARNVGARSARAPVLLFCDADDEVGTRWVNAMVNEMSHADLVGGMIDAEPEQLPQWMDRLPGLPRGPEIGLVMFDGRIQYPPTCSMACRRDDFNAVGGFDEGFEGANSSDLELSLRLLQRGSRLALAAEADVRHSLPTDVRSYVLQQAGCRAADFRILAELGCVEAPRTIPAEIKWTFRRAAHDVVRQREFDPRYHFARCWLQWATFRAHRSAYSKQTRRADLLDEVDTVLPVEAPLVGGIAIRTRRGVANWWATEGVEPLSLRALEVLLPTGGIMVDVGANVGAFTLAGAFRTGSNGRVIAFEPDPRSRELLEQNVRRHGLDDRVEIVPKAAGETEDDREFMLAQYDTVSGFLESPHADHGSSEYLRVEQVRLDSAVSGDVDLLKIDVEGWEMHVLRGATQLLERNPDAAILCEINPDSLMVAGVPLDAVLEMLRDDGRRVLTVLEDDHASPWAGSTRSIDDVVAWIESGGGKRWYANVLAVPFSKLNQLAEFRSTGMP